MAGLVLLGCLAVGVGAAVVALVLPRLTDDAGPEPRVEPDAPAAGSSGAAAVGDVSRAVATVRPDGTIVVQQRVRSGAPLTGVTLALPDLPGTDLVATHVRVIADGERAPGPTRITGDQVAYDVSGATELRLRYRLEGAVQGSDSAAGRALAVATTLDATWSPQLAGEVRVVRAPQVLALACSVPDQDALEPCGTENATDEWQVELAPDRVGERVAAQLTVPGLSPASAAGDAAG